MDENEKPLTDADLAFLERDAIDVPIHGRAADEIRRLRDVMVQIHALGEYLGGDDIGSFCVWCGAEPEPQRSARPHSSDCPWPAIVAAVQA